MKIMRVHMSERVLYVIDVEVEDNATDEAIQVAAERAFLFGDYETVGEVDRRIDGWEPEQDL